MIDQRPQPGEQIQLLADAQIADSPYQARRPFDEQSVEELAQGMREAGFQGVLVVRPHSDPPMRRRGAVQLVYGHRDFVAIISAQTLSGQLQLLAIPPDRLKATVVDWLKSIPASIRAQIITVCTDMWEGYSSAVEEVLPDALIVIDRFHVARQYRDAVDTLRTQEVRRLKKELSKDAQEALKETLWPFRKRSADLDEREQERLDTLLAYSPALEKAYRLREELTSIFDTARSKLDGLRRIGYWRRRVEKSGLNCFASFLSLLERWQDRIANYFIDHQTSGFVEGLNNKLKVLKRRCYGLRNVTRLFQRLTLDLEGYRRFSPWHLPTSSVAHGNS